MNSRYIVLDHTVGKKIDEELELPMKKCSICSSLASLNGAIHWLIAPPCGPAYSPRPESLLAFDLATEKFYVYKTPVLPKNINWLMSLVVLGGYLCFIVNSFLKHNDVWLMKEYGVESSWTWIYKIKQGTVLGIFIIVNL